MKAQAQARKKPGPKPGFNPAINLRREAKKAPAVQAAPIVPSEPPHKDPLQRARDIKTMFGADLKAYAKQIGIRARDIEELTEDKLRQNCMLTVNSLIEAYTE